MIYYRASNGKGIMLVLNIFIVILLVSFYPSILYAAKNVPCGSEWINIHKKNPDLIGVYVQQYPDNIDDRAAYEGKHPCMIIFIFKGNRAHQVSYTPTGQVESGHWFDINIRDRSFFFNNMSKDLKPDVSCHFSLKSKE